MRIIKPSYEILTPISEGGVEELKAIERVGRSCYKSEDKISEDGSSAKRFVKMIIDNGHEAMIEHAPQLTVRFTCDRGISHELVRHRLCSFAQESTRYCNYSNDKFGSEITVIEPPFFEEGTYKYDTWFRGCKFAEKQYFTLLSDGATAQEARSVLPNSLKTEINVTANYREWRAFFKLRVDKAAHPQMRELTIPLLEELKEKIPVVFDDILIEDEARV